VTLSVTEAELVAATQCAQDMLFAMRAVESMGLKVKKPMILEIDNKGAVDLMHNWSVGGRTRHVEVRQYFLRDFILVRVKSCVWILTLRLNPAVSQSSYFGLVGGNNFFISPS
jgi:hypothetical protein